MLYRSLAGEQSSFLKPMGSLALRRMFLPFSQELRIYRGHVALRDREHEQGQVLVIGLIMALGLAMVSFSVANIGMFVAEKIHLQDTVDAAAYSAAVTEARYMNLSAYINRAMIANYNSMAFNTALWAVLDADDHGMAVTTDILYKISEALAVIVITISIAQTIDSIADGFAAIHSVLHDLNATFDDLFAQDEKDLNQYLEVYNIYALTMYQGLLYASLQADRFRVVREVARRMDPEVVTTTTLGLVAEAVSYDELAAAVDWVINDTDARSGVFNQFNRAFNAMMGEDEDTEHPERLLAAVTEASLDPFTAGRNREGRNDLLRQFNTGNLLGNASNFLFDINMSLGASMRDGQENEAFQNHVPKISRRRMRQTNFFGFTFDVSSNVPLIGDIIEAIASVAPSSFGHTSGDRFADVANSVNGILSPLIGLDFERAFHCVLSGTGCVVTVATPTSGFNSLNMLASITMLPTPLLPGPPLFADDHWDGTYGSKPVRSHEFFDPVTGKLEPPQYIADVLSEGLEEGVPKYDWIVDLDNVGFPNYHYSSENSHRRPEGNSRGGNNLISGPSVAVVGIKRARDINGLRGLGIGLEKPNDYPMTAIARAQVYYLRNPKRPDEIPSLFNPHWVARLAPIDDEDSPDLLSEVLPFVAGFGLPFDPTH